MDREQDAGVVTERKARVALLMNALEQIIYKLIKT